MPRPKKSKAEDLARIRNNQRKCRERRRDYLTELEQKLEIYENERFQCYLDSAELQATTEKLRQENEILRKLLGLSSVSEDCQNQSLTDMVNHLWVGWEGSSSQLQRLSSINIEPGILRGKALDEETLHGLPSLDKIPLQLKSDGTELDKFIARGQILPDSAISVHGANINTPTPSFEIASPFRPPLQTIELETLTSTSSEPISSLTLWPVLTDEMAREDRTMLCSIAYRLILQSNKRRYSESEIDNKICHGFRQGRTQSERCRIDNEVLFAVLSEISS